MSNETSKANKRRVLDPNFANRFFVGQGIDIGAGDDPLRASESFPGITVDVFQWDRRDGNAQYMSGVGQDCFDFVYSSHCLEHMVDPVAAIGNWVRICKPGGYIIVSVPDYEMYERFQWPSIFNQDHKWRFTTDPQRNDAIYLPAFMRRVKDAQIVRHQTIFDHFDPSVAPNVDQSRGEAECAIEFILQKRPTA